MWNVQTVNNQVAVGSKHIPLIVFDGYENHGICLKIGFMPP